MTQPTSNTRDTWLEAMATVTACKYEFGAGRALAFGAPSSKHFRITFNYWANDDLQTGEFTSEKAIPQGTLFPVTYNPDTPHEHSRSETSTNAASSARAPIFVVGIIGSIILSTAWFFVMRGCH